MPADEDCVNLPVEMYKQKFYFIRTKNDYTNYFIRISPYKKFCLYCAKYILYLNYMALTLRNPRSIIFLCLTL